MPSATHVLGHVHSHQRTSSHVERCRRQTLSDIDAHATVNTNSRWVNSKGVWTTNIVIICLMRLVFAILPSVSSELAWTLTNLVHNAVSFYMFHGILGTPFEFNTSACDSLTLWEQIDDECQFTPAKKFFTAIPIALFLLSTHYTNYHAASFAINFFSLAIVLIAKLPSMHRVRLFGINKPAE